MLTFPLRLHVQILMQFTDDSQTVPYIIFFILSCFSEDNVMILDPTDRYMNCVHDTPPLYLILSRLIPLATLHAIVFRIF